MYYSFCEVHVFICTFPSCTGVPVLSVGLAQLASRNPRKPDDIYRRFAAYAPLLGTRTYTQLRAATNSRQLNRQPPPLARMTPTCDPLQTLKHKYTNISGGRSHTKKGSLQFCSTGEVCSCS
ncbi:uncharacterized protein H6S33_003493 [Morchella sextelata]|uniref:uncharacterized protein n=1 Tax=Morchella sextelata TaxID=1174677 RepID=UPI001D050C23|nr:uncharacterized protein H6S33_003493 [Morchella sextelata]KAH0606659.1 hypothetical protein H6S33_003493 [Morchella sextelata]